MKRAQFVLTAPAGIHARPAGNLVKEAGKFEAAITVRCKDKSASAKKLFALMKLGAKQGDSLAVEAEGPDEDAAMAAVMAFMEEHF